MVGRRDKPTDARVRDVPGAELDGDLSKCEKSTLGSLDRDGERDGLGGAVHGELTGDAGFGHRAWIR